MRNEKTLSRKTRDTKTHKVTVTKIEGDCYCCTPETRDNCDCYEKRKDLSWEQKRLRQATFGPCIVCKGTGRHVWTKTTRVKKDLFIGGPFDGKVCTNRPVGYVPFNCAQRGHSRNTAYIHKSLLKEGDD